MLSIPHTNTNAHANFPTIPKTCGFATATTKNATIPLPISYLYDGWVSKNGANLVYFPANFHPSIHFGLPSHTYSYFHQIVSSTFWAIFRHANTKDYPDSLIKAFKQHIRVKAQQLLLLLLLCTFFELFHSFHYLLFKLESDFISWNPVFIILFSTVIRARAQAALRTYVRVITVSFVRRDCTWNG